MHGHKDEIMVEDELAFLKCIDHSNWLCYTRLITAEHALAFDSPDVATVETPPPAPCWVILGTPAH
jgi:hypothetical protein